MKKRDPNSTGGGGVALGLIITPMLDMSFQILAFFIMTYNPSALEGHINGKLVPSAQAIVNPANFDPKEVDLIPSDIDPEITIQVIAKAVKIGERERDRMDGQPTAIYVKNPEDAEPTLVADSDETLERSLEKLAARLKAAKVGGAMGTVRLDCGPDMKLRYITQLYDVCKSAGFQNVSFVAPIAPRAKR